MGDRIRVVTTKMSGSRDKANRQQCSALLSRGVDQFYHRVAETLSKLTSRGSGVQPPRY